MPVASGTLRAELMAAALMVAAHEDRPDAREDAVHCTECGHAARFIRQATLAKRTLPKLWA